jgi:hypothetical protein
MMRTSIYFYPVPSQSHYQVACVDGDNELVHLEHVVLNVAIVIVGRVGMAHLNEPCREERAQATAMAMRGAHYPNGFRFVYSSRN